MSKRLPPWLVPSRPRRPQMEGLGRRLAGMGTHTVCQSARCPNLGECFSQGNATFMIMGDVCTRDCRFCAVGHGRPGPLDPGEPQRVAEAARMLGLRHVVITSVTRDDLADGGAAHFAAAIDAVRRTLPEATVEVLVPDFGGRADSLETVLAAGPDVLNHNVETIARLYPRVRPQADYSRSLELLRRASGRSPGCLTKSGFMVGLGESFDEVVSLLADLRSVGTHAVTIGQYLQPTPDHLPVAGYVPPAVFEEYGRAARRLGFRRVLSGPLVRSSYHAGDLVGN